MKRRVLLRKPQSSQWRNQSFAAIGGTLFLLVVLGVVFSLLPNEPLPSSRRLTRIRRDVTVYLDKRSPVLGDAKVVGRSQEEQAAFMQHEGTKCHANILNVYSSLLPHFQVELYKYCVLYLNGGLFVHADSPLLVTVHDLVGDYTHMAVLGSAFESTMHGSILLLPSKSPIAKQMLQTMMDNSLLLQENPLLLPRRLYQLVSQGIESKKLTPGAHGSWMILQQRCHADPLNFSSRDEPFFISRKTSESNTDTFRLTHHCPVRSGYCCDIFDSVEELVVLMTQHPLLPYQVLPPTSELSRPFSSKYDNEAELPFITTVSEKKLPTHDVKTPNLYDILFENDCLPTQKQCNSCLRDKKGANCHTCRKVCACYCKSLCNTKVMDKKVVKEVSVRPPRFSNDPSRLIPRIVHQTWFEAVSPDQYPNMSRLMESWKRSGWDYRFFTDAEAAEFLSLHFPPEVREAYDALNPGAFKADLFRYCALLIHGGVYADMDVLLETNLDAAIAPDVGFMVPVDEPGKQVGHRMCLWNGFIAAAPGHPFLAKVIQTVVNNVRNRFTAVDYDNMFCPDPELSVLHAFDTLFSAGPCVLGYSVNSVLGRSLQESFEDGDLENTGHAVIPGRSVILHQNKWDMGAHRFTWLEQNLVVAATDMPDYDDRKQLGGQEHYSKVHVKDGVYGVHKLYVDRKIADEEIRMVVDL